MNYYMFATEQQKTQLHRYSVDFLYWNDDVVFFQDADELDRACDALGANHTSEADTDLSDCRAITLWSGSSAVTVEWDDDNLWAQGLLYRNSPRPTESTRNEAAPAPPAAVHYVEFFSSRINTQREEERLKEKLDRDLARAKKEFLEASRRQAFPDAKPSDGEIIAKLTSELAEIRKHPAVIEARPIPHGFLVRTKKLYATIGDTGSKHEIGEFYLWIKLPLKEASLVWTNCTRRLADSGHNAPTIGKDGLPFDIEVKQVVLDLIARYELAQLVDLAIQCVESVAPDHAEALAVWPKAE